MGEACPTVEKYSNTRLRNLENTGEFVPSGVVPWPINTLIIITRVVKTEMMVTVLLMPFNFVRGSDCFKSYFSPL